MAEVGGDHVVAIDVRGLQIEPGDVVERLLAAARHRDADLLRVAAVAGDDVWQHFKSPGLEQRGQVARGGRPRRAGLARLCRLQFGMRVDKDQRLAAPQHELVDREQGLGRQILRVHQHQHIDIRRDYVDVGVERLDLVELLQLVDDRHRPARPALHHGRHVALERQGADQPDDGLFRDGQGVDQLGQVVFEKALALGREKRDDLLVVGRIGRGEAEINLVAFAVERHGLQTERHRAVLDIGKRLRVVGFETDFAVRRRDILVEQFAHALGVDAIGRNLVAKLL